jgi:hypothetical protein
MEFLFQGMRPHTERAPHTGFKPIRSKPLKQVISKEEDTSHKLPDEYASDMMDLEIQCEAKDVSIETVRKLMGLYSQAIDYYVANQSDKYLFFKKKMANLMIQPQVIEAMEVAHRRKTFEIKEKELSFHAHSERGPVRCDRNALTPKNNQLEMVTTPNVRKVDSEIKRQQFELARNLSNINHSDRLREIVENHELTSSKNNYMVQSNLKQQLEALSSKLQQRKMAAQTGSTISGFTREVPRDVAEMSERSDSRDRAITGFAGQQPFKHISGMKRCGSHKVMTSTPSKRL